jgi:glutaredoxin
MFRLLWKLFKPLCVILLIAGPSLAADMDKRAFAECIAESGARYYGTHWCPYCKKQNALFGEDARYLPYIECSPKGSRESLARCSEVSGYPTWIFPNAGKRGGVQSFTALEKYTGCRLEPKDYFVD